MALKGLLFDLEWCSGCRSCEIACQMEHGFAVGQTGIKVFEIGPWQYGENKWVLSYLPGLTAQCDGCANRVAQGKLPTCVQHCQAQCIEYGDVEDLAKSIDGKSNKMLVNLNPIKK